LSRLGQQVGEIEQCQLPLLVLVVVGHLPGKAEHLQSRFGRWMSRFSIEAVHCGKRQPPLLDLIADTLGGLLELIVHRRIIPTLRAAQTANGSRTANLPEQFAQVGVAGKPHEGIEKLLAPLLHFRVHRGCFLEDPPKFRQRRPGKDLLDESAAYFGFPKRVPTVEQFVGRDVAPAIPADTVAAAEKPIRHSHQSFQAEAEDQLFGGRIARRQQSAEPVLDQLVDQQLAFCFVQ